MLSYAEFHIDLQPNQIHTSIQNLTKPFKRTKERSVAALVDTSSTRAYCSILSFPNHRREKMVEQTIEDPYPQEWLKTSKLNRVRELPARKSG